MDENKKIELKTDELDKISGGYIYLNHEGAYEVLDWNGDVVETYSGPDGYNKCVEICKKRGFSDRLIEWEDLEEIRQIKEGTY